MSLFHVPLELIICNPKLCRNAQDPPNLKEKIHDQQGWIYSAENKGRTWPMNMLTTTINSRIFSLSSHPQTKTKQRPMEVKLVQNVTASNQAQPLLFNIFSQWDEERSENSAQFICQTLL